MKRVKNVLSVFAILMVVFRACGASSSDGEPMVGRHSFVINGPVGGAGNTMASGPIMGNGDVGIMLSGPADALTFYIGKNDSWSSFLSGIRDASVLTVRRMRIMTPALQGATLKTTIDMQHAEMKNGVVSGVKIVSEKGRDCTVVNPWSGRKVTLVRNGGRPGSSAETKQGERFSFRTAVNETIELSPGK